MAQYAVVGLGRFGATLALQLMKMGHDVVGIDSDRRVIEAFADTLTYTAVADVTDEHALRELNPTAYDAVIIAIGENLQASLLCVVHLKNMGIENIWVKATTQAHHLILSRLGVDHIIHPEEEMGARTAQALAYPMIREYITLGDKQYIVEVKVTERMAGASLAELLSSVKGDVFGILVKRRAQLFPNPADQFLIEPDDTVVLAGVRKSLLKLADRFM
ncbi:potassium channel family protein [Methylobacter sp. YRD-M1]|uniref:potassium channel family protein n=1 Tax=Methylobacter sp. YRD-M1 TaxID=2911520 RepID=UPI00227BA071|nr:TrkA family potassium uptake protein [Methylobacter sp. YRD-M1]WAK02319.1 TrkA family potassium uptake protein [Methylobacter sp. YRD-M1]